MKKNASFLRVMCSKYMRIFWLVTLVIICSVASAQEYDSFRAYKKTTGQDTLREGCWLRKDRKRNSSVWQRANAYNLQQDSGSLRYRSIGQRSDFYSWYCSVMQERAHSLQWPCAAGVVSGQFARLDNWAIRTLVIRNKGVVRFANQANRAVWEDVFPALREAYTDETPWDGEEVARWDSIQGMHEQCEVLQPLYEQLSSRTLRKLERMARGKGVFALGVSKRLRYEGDMLRCEDRYRHGSEKVLRGFTGN